MRFSSPLDETTVPLKFLLRLELLQVALCFLAPLVLTGLPDPDKRNRFDDAECVFCFGILLFSSI